MKSSGLKRFLGIIISIILILSSLCLITVFSVKDTFSKNNVQGSLDSINLKSYLTDHSGTGYDTFKDSARAIGISDSQLDDILKAKAFNKIFAEVISDMILGVFDGKNPVVTLEEKLGTVVKANIVDTVNAIDFNAAADRAEEQAILKVATAKMSKDKVNNLSDEQKKKLVADTRKKLPQQELAKYEELKQKTVDNGKDELTKLICDFVESVRASILKSEGGRLNQDCENIQMCIFAIYAVVIICIVLLFVMFLRHKRFLLCFAINSFFIAFGSFIIYFLTSNYNEGIAEKLALSITSTSILTKIVNDVASYLIKASSAVYFMATYSLFGVAIVLTIVYMIVRPKNSY